jgi:hypothetical protein
MYGAFDDDIAQLNAGKGGHANSVKKMILTHRHFTASRKL